MKSPEMWSVVLSRRFTAIQQLSQEGKIRRDILWYSNYTEEEHELIRARMRHLKEEESQ
jgi:hypothetical protein